MKSSLLFFAIASCLLAQNLGGPTFEAASVRLSPPPDSTGFFSGSRGGPGSPDPTRVTMQNFNLRNLIAIGYDLPYYRLSGAEWTGGVLLDITATMAEGTTKEAYMLMVQDLLAERFHLKIHREQKEMPVYELQVAKGGHKLTPSKGEPAPQTAPAGPPDAFTPPKLDSSGFPTLPPGRSGMAMINGNARMQRVNTSIAQLTRDLSAQLQRPVFDATALTGNYDFKLDWITRSRRPPAPGETGGVIEEPGIPITDVIENQLGLRLQQKKGTVEILVIDSVDNAPTEN